jgi:PEP-CTERM/exosortase A-associated glycosyltransferase
MTPLRILHVLDHSLPHHSGYAYRTVAILREQRALGWQTQQVTTPRQGPSPTPVQVVDGWTFHRTACESRARGVAGYVQEMRATMRSLEERVEAFAPDVIHAHSPVLNLLPALTVGRRRGIPVVYELRALWEDAAVDHGTTTEGSLRYRVSRALETFGLRHAHHVTTICEGLRLEVMGRGVPESKITVIPNAVDAAQFPFGGEPDAALRDRLGLAGATVIGFAGSFYAYEGLDLLLEAVARMAGAHPSLRLLLVGGGYEDELLRARARQLGIADRTIFTGSVPHRDVQHYYGLIDVLAYPRRPMRLTDVVTPLKPLEAMARGRILVASDVGGHRELVRDGQTGFLFRAGDVDALVATLERVLAMRDEWPGLQANARRYVETERTWTRSVGRYADVYELVRAAPVPDIAPQTDRGR